MKAYEVIVGEIRDDECRIRGMIREYYLDKQKALKRYKEGEYTETMYIERFTWKGQSSDGYVSKEYWEKLKEWNKDKPYYTYITKDEVKNCYTIKEINIIE